MRLDHDAIEPAVVAVAVGAVTLTATNRDDAPHAVLLVRASVPADRVPTTGVRVDGADPPVTVLARTPPLAPGAAGPPTASVAPATSVLVRSVPRHDAREAMVATMTMTVTG